MRDTSRICVSYRDDAEHLPLPAELQPTASIAASRSNAILRSRSGYERITDSIASRYGLSINEQVYHGRVLLAGFGLPDGTDGDALLATLRSEYSQWISSADYSQLYEAAFSPDDPVYVASDDGSGGQWNLKHMHIEAAWEHTLGDPAVLLAVVDTGINMTHSEFGPALLDPAVEFPGTNCDIANDDAGIEDNHGHGSFIGGQIIATSDNAEGIAGAAPGIRLFPVKISDDGGNESLERIIAGCMLAYTLGAKVISLSWGGGGNEVMQAMTEEFAANDVLLVASAGNHGNNFVTWPGAYPDAMAVGNSLPDDSRMASSSFGPALDVVAPGWNLTSLAPDSMDGLVSGSSGTSYAAPLVSAAAALLWSVEPGITLTQMRGLLETSGPEASGFGEGVQVRRLDFQALFDNAVNPSLRFTPPSRVVQHGSMELSFELRGIPQSISISLDDEPLATLSSGPWTHELSLDGLHSGLHELQATADFGEGQLSSHTLKFVNAGEAMQFPASEHFTQDFGFCSPLDLSQYDPQAMAELAMQDYSGIERQLREHGRASWYRYLKPGTEVPQYMLQIAHDGYGKHELDAVLTRPALVPDTDQPTLSLEHRCNVTDVLQRIYISSDHGLSWQPALTTDGTEAPMGGFILPHTRIELDLRPYIGEEVIVMFLLAADEGSEAQWNEFEWGWWLDVLSFGEDGWIDLPVAALEQPGEPVFGALTGSQLFSVRPANDSGLAIAHWWLDYPAFHVELPQDQRVSVSGIGPHGYSFDLSGSIPGNVETLLHLTVIDIHGNVSNELEIPAWRYDLAGDVNADGLVDEADTAALQQHLASGLPYMPFADCNFDGVVDEFDNAVIGYSFSN